MIGTTASFGLKYASAIQVYYLILAWVVLAALAMFFLTQTPLGRMANATRDNFERAQFMGYDPRMVRFLQFALSGFFAGIGGGLYAITYEIVTFDALAAPLSANALLMAYIGGSAVFGGPVLGAVLITLLQSGVSLLSNSWLVYVGVLFITMVMFAPKGIMGLVFAHRPVAHAGLLGQLALPYLRVILPGIADGAWLCRSGRTDLVPDHRRRAGQDACAVRRQDRRACAAAVAHLNRAACLAGVVWFRVEARAFHRVWKRLMARSRAAARALA